MSVEKAVSNLVFWFIYFLIWDKLKIQWICLLINKLLELAGDELIQLRKKTHTNVWRMNSFAELTVNNKWDGIKTTAAATTTWCFTPSRPVQLYQGDGQGREIVHAECQAEWQGGLGSWGQWLAPDVCGQGVLRPVNQYSYIRAMDKAGRLSTLNAELNVKMGLDLGENGCHQMSVDKTEKLSMLNAKLNDRVGLDLGGGWWVSDICGQDKGVVHTDHWAEWTGFGFGENGQYQ